MTTIEAPPAVALPERFLRVDRVHVIAACAVALVSFGQAWWRWSTWRNGFGDMPVIAQVSWLLAHGKEPIISGLGWNAFADHLAPIYLVFGALYRVHETVGWVFAAEAIAFGVSVLALPALLDALGVSGRAKTMFQIAFVLSPLMWNAVAFAGHPTTMAVPVLIVGLTAALRGRVGSTAVAVLALLVFRDDLGIAAAAIALIGLAHDPERRWMRWGGVAALAIGWEVLGGLLATHVGVDRLWLQRFSYLGATPHDALLHPWSSVPALIGEITSTAQITQIVFWLASVAFLPLLAPKRLLVVLVVGMPILAAHDPTVQSVHFHHGAVLVPFLLWAAAGGLVRWRSLAGSDFPVGALPILAGALLVISGPFAAGDFDHSAVTRRDGAGVLARLTTHDRLLADPAIGIHAADREMAVTYPYPFQTSCGGAPVVNGVRNSVIWPTSEIDTIAVLAPRTDAERAQLDAVVKSPCFADLGRPEQIGNVLLYRRVAG